MRCRVYGSCRKNCGTIRCTHKTQCTLEMSKRTKSNLGQALRAKFLRGAEYGLGVVAGAATFGATGNEPLAAAAGYATEAAMHRADDYLFGLDSTQQASQDMEEIPVNELTFFTRQMTGTRKPMYKARNKKRAVSKKLVVYRAPRTEVKHFDIQNNLTINPAGNWSFSSLGPFPIQGTDNVNRIGRKIKVLSISFKCNLLITAPAQVPLYGTGVRCLIVKDKETKGAILNQNDLFDVTLISPPVMNNPFNSANKRRFNVVHSSIHDIVVTSQNAGVTTSVNNHQNITAFIKSPCIINYQSNSGTVADNIDYNFVLAICSTNAAVATSIGSMYAYTRIFYTDV